jgi:hypothetical protein
MNQDGCRLTFWTGKKPAQFDILALTDSAHRLNLRLSDLPFLSRLLEPPLSRAMYQKGEFVICVSMINALSFRISSWRPYAELDDDEHVRTHVIAF